MKSIPIIYRYFILLCAALLLIPSGPAAPSLMAGSHAGDEHSAVRTRTQYMALNVTALDGRGDPVRDLTESDFAIYDDGKPEPLATFQAGASEPNDVAPPPTTLIIFDLLNGIIGQREYTAKLIIHALEPEELGESYCLYILSNRGEILTVHGVPSAQEWVPLTRGRSAGAKEKPEPPPWTKQIHPLLDQAIEQVNAFRPNSHWDLGWLAATTFQALSELGQRLSPIPGPKTIVWISAGVGNWPTYPYGCHDETFPEGSGSYLAGKCTDKCRGYHKCVDYTPFLQHFTTELNQNNTLFYSAEETAEGSTPLIDHGTSADTLQQLVALTGGRLYAVNDIEKAITQSVRNARARYQLVYVAPPPNGKYHKLRVTCARSGVRLEFPRGYYSLQP